jgi:hypothetical protein
VTDVRRGFVFIVLGVVVVLGALAGWLAPRRGDAAPTITVTPAVPRLLGAALALQVALRLLPDDQRNRFGASFVGISALLVAAALGLVALPRSPLRPVAVLALVGGGLNAAVMLANGGMPVSVEAAEQAGLVPTALGDDDPTARHVELDDDTRLPFLADVVPLHVGPERAVFSAGDVVLLAAVAGAGFAFARHSRRSRHSAGDGAGAVISRDPTPGDRAPSPRGAPST